MSAVLVVVVAAVGGETLGTVPRAADPASYGRDGVNERDQLGDVIAVAAREPPSERDPGPIDQEVVLGAVSARSTGLGPVSEPLFRLHVTRIRHGPRPLDRAYSPQLGEQERVQPLPYACLLPLIKAAVAGRTGAEAASLFVQSVNIIDQGRLQPDCFAEVLVGDGP